MRMRTRHLKVALTAPPPFATYAVLVARYCIAFASFLPCRYRPTISIAFVLRELLFNVEEEGVTFLRRCGVNFTPDGREVACKTSSIDASGLDADAPNSLL